MSDGRGQDYTLAQARELLGTGLADTRDPRLCAALGLPAPGGGQ